MYILSCYPDILWHANVIYNLVHNLLEFVLVILQVAYMHIFMEHPVGFMINTVVVC